LKRKPNQLQLMLGSFYSAASYHLEEPAQRERLVLPINYGKIKTEKKKCNHVYEWWERAL